VERRRFTSPTDFSNSAAPNSEAQLVRRSKSGKDASHQSKTKDSSTPLLPADHGRYGTDPDFDEREKERERKKACASGRSSCAYYGP
jgi:hypothetical protein